MTADNGVCQQELRDDVASVLPDDARAMTGDKAADAQPASCSRRSGSSPSSCSSSPGIALVVGSFLIINTFSILVAQRSRELALLRALGASRRQVSRSVLFEAFVVGVIG